MSEPTIPFGTRPLRRSSTARLPVEQVVVREGVAQRRPRRDWLATEEPLEIRVEREDGPPVPLAVTMRTPGADFELAAGFLWGEGLVEERAAVESIRYCVEGEQQYNVVSVRLSGACRVDPETVRRNFYATSSCGVCGKASIEAVLAPVGGRVESGLTVSADTLLLLPARLRAAQAVFERTGGLHAAASFDAAGTLVHLREDVGRHNAMDKLVGASLLAGELPLGERVVLVSGRLSFELVQKAARAGAAVLAGVSAPSSLAVELAREAGLTLVGFLRETGFNVYAAGERVTTD